MIPRMAAPTVEKLAADYPVVAVTGPRQSGKTTLTRSVFADKAYVSLEDLDERNLATSDPRAFLARYKDGAILDEVQHAGDLLTYLQRDVDETRQMGRWVLTGSQQFGVLTGVSQTLAGRIALLRLLPLSLPELQGAGLAPTNVEDLLFRGFYPPIHDRELDPAVWFDNYVATYVERDVRQMINVRDLSTFQRFVRMCAARTGQLLNLSALAADCGITHNTSKAWLSVLEASFLIHLVTPHHQNFNKRLVKTPKLYFLDPGLAAWLLAIERPEDLAIHAMRGPLFETWVVTEALKARYQKGLRPNIHFWRDRSGFEVDLVVERSGRLDATEIKSGQTFATDYMDSLRKWRTLAGEQAGDSWLVFGGEATMPHNESTVVGWQDIDTWIASLTPRS